ncbi:hypothetical protein ACO34A_01590 [Rhizobium sp. ACO-34A]|nr:N-6 DNA methylase [Rhizobium sp. ACO-34A]ATN32502.1 hypothetical protein ACO34A_01590 [Rhizobium sp. ACO-34A]
MMSMGADRQQRALATLLKKLGYNIDGGWIAAEDVDRLKSHRFALQQARDEMALAGAFCLRTADPTAAVTPLVYVSLAVDSVAAQEIHRRVWSQGLAPYLLIVTGDQIYVCNGFSYAHSDWIKTVHQYDFSQLQALPDEPLQSVRLHEDIAHNLWDLRAVKLRTSLFWRDHSIDVDGRVDRRLLNSLNALSTVLIAGRGVSTALSPQAANGLIGRFLYVFFLADRRIIDENWLAARGHGDIALRDQMREWSAASTFKLFDDLDFIFNGSVFPLNAAHRAEIDHTHINLVRLVMKHDAEPGASGSVQLSFFDFYLGVIRTETLSSVYEQFLENLEEGERRRSGAFYTPPFIVDFMLDRLEEEIALADGVKLLDPAAGSGVFLVGAYRRIVERSRLTAPHRPLELDDVRGLLTRNIFAVERNIDACNVAAFSLYLTMLDYVDPRDLTRIAAGQDPEKLFPPVVGHNILHADFFEDGVKIDLPMVSCVVGNPPWQTVQKLRSKAAIDWQIKNSRRAPIGKGQVAELFVWKVLFDHLEEGGYLSFLIPSKSFVNPTSWKFRKELARRYTIVGAANFAHFRHRLFAKAKHPGIAAFFRKCATPPRHQCWIYSPLSTSQPVAGKKRPWTIILDRADVQHVRQERLARDPRGWFDALVLRPIDRQIQTFISDQVELGKISTFETLSLQIGAGVSRGGSPSETGIEERYLLDAPDDVVEGAGDDPSASGAQGSLLDDEMIVLPPEQLARVAPSYAQKFSGNILLVPRNMKRVRVVQEPIGFTSSSMAFFFKKPAQDVNAREVRLLAAAGRYLASQFGLYMIATTGRRWMLDRRNLEPEDLKALAVPISGVDDPRIDGILTAKADTLDTYLMTLLGLTEEMQKAVCEFLDFRMGFQDGDIPDEALTLPKPEALNRYRDTVTEQLASLSGRNGAFVVDCLAAPDAGVGALAAHYVATFEPHLDLTATCRGAIEAYFGASGNAFTDSLSLRTNDQQSIVTVVKPLEYYRWTIDSAVADSQKIFSAFMAQ